jgi:hypothetical protein
MTDMIKERENELKHELREAEKAAKQEVKAIEEATKDAVKEQEERIEQQAKAEKELVKQQEKEMKAVDRKLDADVNADPISGAPGAHPVGTGLGAAGGAAAGAAIGTMVGGPVGTLAGGAIGAVAGGLAGSAAGEAVNPTVEDAYWRQNYSTRPYVKRSEPYDRYRPAYKYGWEARETYRGKTFTDIESSLQSDWERKRRENELSWNDARGPVRDAWEHVEVKA